jgi:hypothetical protein
MQSLLTCQATVSCKRPTQYVQSHSTEVTNVPCYQLWSLYQLLFLSFHYNYALYSQMGKKCTKDFVDGWMLCLLAMEVSVVWGTHLSGVKNPNSSQLQSNILLFLAIPVAIQVCKRHQPNIHFSPNSIIEWLSPFAQLLCMSVSSPSKCDSPLRLFRWIFH